MKGNTMEFQRARTKDQIENRVEEILNSAIELYDEMDYDEITLRMISDRTSLSRTTMYTYYKTKEEIFLDLVKKEYLIWNDALSERFHEKDTFTKEEFCRIMTDTLYENKPLMRLLAIQQTIIEKNSSLEQLTSFKKETMELFDTLAYGIHKTFPNATDININLFEVHLMIYILGFYPNTHPVQKQVQSMALAGMELPAMNSKEILNDGLLLLTSNL